MMKALKKLLLNQGVVIEHSSTRSDLELFAKKLNDAMSSVDLVRVGGDFDGGYLLPNDLDDMRYCFSPGVADTATFEEELANKHDMRCFMADASVEKAPISHSNFDFEKKFLGFGAKEKFFTLSEWMDLKLPKSDRGDMILQMDIEGSEYDVLIECSRETLREFRILVLEVHGLERVFRRGGLPLLNAVFEKIHKDFALVHMHPNNSCGEATCHDITLPRVLEMTYLRKDRVHQVSVGEPIQLPHPLDQKNVENMDDIELPEIWWKQP